MINGTTNTVSKTGVLGNNPSALAVNRLTNTLYIVDCTKKGVFAINGLTNSAIGKTAHIIEGLKIGNNPSAIAINPKADKIYVLNNNSHGVSVISVLDGKTDRIIKSPIPVNGKPDGIVVNPNTDRIYISTSDPPSVYSIDDNTSNITSRYEVNASNHVGWNMVIDPNTDRLYVADWSQCVISVFKGVQRTPIDTIPDFLLPFGGSGVPCYQPQLAIDPSINMLYVIDGDPFNTVTEIDDNPHLNHPGGIPVNKIPLPAPAGSRPAVNPNNNILYLGSPEDSHVYALDSYTGKIVASIYVGGSPSAISVNPNTNMVYVSNSDPTSNYVSTINGTTNQLMKPPITTGVGQKDIIVNPNSNTVYVIPTYGDFDFIPVIDGASNTLAAGVTFNINPPNSGYIECNGKQIVNNAYMRIKLGTSCNPISSSGFGFTSWSEKIGKNSSRIISISTTSNSPLGLFGGGGNTANDRSTLFNVSSYGNFVANFREIPPILPPAYLDALYLVAASILTGYLVPNAASWINSIRQKSKERERLRDYEKRIEKLDQNNDNYSKDLAKLEYDLHYSLAVGEINDAQYNLLEYHLNKENSRT